MNYNDSHLKSLQIPLDSYIVNINRETFFKLRGRTGCFKSFHFCKDPTIYFSLDASQNCLGRYAIIV